HATGVRPGRGGGGSWAPAPRDQTRSLGSEAEAAEQTQDRIQQTGDETEQSIHVHSFVRGPKPWGRIHAEAHAHCSNRYTGIQPLCRSLPFRSRIARSSGWSMPPAAIG